MTKLLLDLGFNDFFDGQLPKYGIGHPYRIAEDYGRRFTVIGVTDDGVREFDLVFSRDCTRAPIVGDWIVALPVDGRTVEYIDTLERKSCFSRATQNGELQALAANVDRLFVVTTCTSEFNLSRLERYLVLAKASNVEPVVVLNKVDLVAGDNVYAQEIASELGSGVAVCSTSTVFDDGMEQLRAMIGPGETCVFVGSSGVGKSSIVNELTDTDRQKTLGVSAKGARGSHTTTSRSLFRLPGGGLVIDTPGIRSVGVAAQGDELNDTFEDIASLQSQCAFRDCRHEEEAGCAVMLAVDEGRLSMRRLNSYKKLQREITFFEDPDAARRQQRSDRRKMAANRISREKLERKSRH
ncbi:ribosome small subunit-dependent GTPase A [Paraburkholderia sp. SIMBA_027]|uniref:ribosome small subunit-dependent GTPase A n=1 Tax=Paraburkholderia sp. SIMBA_027 TaxID=3085770 RepID=UPI00397E7410